MSKPRRRIEWWRDDFRISPARLGFVDILTPPALRRRFKPDVIIASDDAAVKYVIGPRFKTAQRLSSFAA